MYNIKTLNKISEIGTSRFGGNYKYGDDVENPDAIILRSYNMHDMDIPKSVKAIARAGAGVNNIPIDKCSEKGIVVFNTPGANANAVKELVIAAILLSSRKIVKGINWANTLTDEADNITKAVEKGKSQFVGPEILGKKLGVIGLGAIGVMVSNAAHALGMDVVGFDPYISVDAAWGLSRAIHKASSMKEIFDQCDYITIHVPLNDETKDTINAETIAEMKDGVRILNFARGGLVNSEAIIKAVESGKVSCYVTDFPDKNMINKENIIAIPHLGASTPESEDNCAVMAVNELVDYLENGNITNSVNFPRCSMERSTDVRICIIHKNIPNMIGQISKYFADKNVNIENMINKGRGEYAYTIVDVDHDINEDTIDFEGVIDVRVIK
ncbi:MAG: phosphoglycerate dehydrogenase [Clostridia bacterium]|nr:phosphoglycerate dehydrogenase [Clostridia bacterium]